MSDYVTLKGKRIALDDLTKEDALFLFDLALRGFRDDEGFCDLRLELAGPGAYPLKGSERVTKAIHNTPVYRIAEDLVDRVGIRQGAVGPDADDADAFPVDVLSAGEAAHRLGISRSAVAKALNEGRLRGRKIGRSWMIPAESVERYQVAEHRVRAGKQRGRSATDGIDTEEVRSVLEELKEAGHDRRGERRAKREVVRGDGMEGSVEKKRRMRRDVASDSDDS